MLHGWHGHNGVSLGNPRLGFVCTGQTVEGDAGLEGYYLDYGREIAPEERVRFTNEKPPRYDAATAPKLDSADWPEERLRKVERSYAMEYVRSLLPVTQDLFGTEEASALVGRTARLIGLQFFEETAGLIAAPDFVHYLAAIASAQGENVEIRDGAVLQRGWKLMQGVSLADRSAAFKAWNALWEGALAAYDRDLALHTQFDDDTIVWRVDRPR
jgi:hypothetical protein